MRLHLRAEVARAARHIVPTWPLNAFIAVNPLGAFEGRHFERLHLENGAADIHSCRSLESYRDDLAAGRITEADLAAAVDHRMPELAAAGSVTLGDRSLTPAELITAELVLAEIGPGGLVSVGPSAAGPATRERARERGIASPENPLGLVDHYVSSWVAAYLSPDALWPMPGRDRGLFSAWREMAAHDTRLPRSARRRLRGLPQGADDALAWAMDGLYVAVGARGESARAELDRLPGWTAHIRWRADAQGDIDLTSYLALRFCVRFALNETPQPAPSSGEANEFHDDLWSRAEALVRVLDTDPAEDSGRPVAESVAVIARILAAHPPRDHVFTWQRAYELHYSARLLAKLPAATADSAAHPIGATSPSTSPRRSRPHMQFVACIDPRSEGIRRHLESVAGIETLGFAGFFGVPIRYVGYRARGGVDSLPALLRPRHTVTEAPRVVTGAQRARVGRRFAALKARDAASAASHAAETFTAAPFAWAELSGWFWGVIATTRTLAPGLMGRVDGWASRAFLPTVDTDITVADSFSLDERAQLAETAVRMMGLDRCAPLVVLAGHGSTSTNNLYQSALDCGACGGNAGAPNARAAAAIFNDGDVRERLRARGIDVPDDTFFVAAEHDTVSDRVTVLDAHLVPATHRGLVEEFAQNQRQASDLLVRERSAALPGGGEGRSIRRLRARAHDWAEVYPELGLAGNAAMIVGPREMTEGVDLERRVFLHSYRPELDPDGGALESILTAPMVVAQWINHQYYFSTIAPDTLGAGTKTIHNAIGTLGVLSGQGGDLRRGLPWQSVGFGRALLHEPMRLAVVAQAPLDRVGAIIARNEVLRNLFDNEWITMTARDDGTSPWHRYGTYGWAPLLNSTTRPDSSSHAVPPSEAPSQREEES